MTLESEHVDARSSHPEEYESNDTVADGNRGETGISNTGINSNDTGMPTATFAKEGGAQEHSQLPSGKDLNKLQKGVKGSQSTDSLQSNTKYSGDDSTNASSLAESSQQNKTLYLGNLHPFVTELHLQEVFAGLDGIAELKVTKDKATGISAGFGFAKFTEHEYATIAFERVGTSPIVLFGQEIRVNWAFKKEASDEAVNHVHIFVGDLAPDVTDAVLLTAFQKLPGCQDAFVQWDHGTGRSRGYGFVSFASKEEAETAIEAMHGQFVGARRVRCSWAQHKTEPALPMDPLLLNRTDPTNTNVYVGNLSPSITDAEIRRQFAAFGPIVELKIQRKGGFGFVRFKSHDDAVHAILTMNGKVLGDKTLKCSWGRHPNAPPRNVQANLMMAAATAGVQVGVQGVAVGGPHGTLSTTPTANMLSHVHHTPVHHTSGYMGGGLVGMPMTSAAAAGLIMGAGPPPLPHLPNSGPRNQGVRTIAQEMSHHQRMGNHINGSMNPIMNLTHGGMGMGMAGLGGIPAAGPSANMIALDPHARAQMYPSPNGSSPYGMGHIFYSNQQSN
jgi:nucleolysin TIA-1/TIAR